MVTLYDLMRLIHMSMRSGTKGLNPRFEMGPYGHRIWVTDNGKHFEVTIARVVHVPEHLAQAGL